jgi:hypothetical protein
MSYQEAVQELAKCDDACWLDALLIAAEFDTSIERVQHDVHNLRYLYD